MRNVLVTGGSRGLGLGIARRLAAGGDRVVAVARQPTDELAAAIRDATETGHGALEFRACDLSDIAGIRGFVATLRREARHDTWPGEQRGSGHQRHPGNHA